MREEEWGVKMQRPATTATKTTGPVFRSQIALTVGERCPWKDHFKRNKSSKIKISFAEIHKDSK